MPLRRRPRRRLPRGCTCGGAAAFPAAAASLRDLRLQRLGRGVRVDRALAHRLRRVLRALIELPLRRLVVLGPLIVRARRIRLTLEGELGRRARSDVQRRIGGRQIVDGPLQRGDVLRVDLCVARDRGRRQARGRAHLRRGLGLRVGRALARGERIHLPSAGRGELARELLGVRRGRVIGGRPGRALHLGRVLGEILALRVDRAACGLRHASQRALQRRRRKSRHGGHRLGRRCAADIGWLGLRLVLNRRASSAAPSTALARTAVCSRVGLGAAVTAASGVHCGFAASRVRLLRLGTTLAASGFLGRPFRGARRVAARRPAASGFCALGRSAFGSPDGLRSRGGRLPAPLGSFLNASPAHLRHRSGRAFTDFRGPRGALGRSGAACTGGGDLLGRRTRGDFLGRRLRS